MNAPRPPPPPPPPPPRSVLFSPRLSLRDPWPAWFAQLEALYALLDDDGSGTLTVHEMIDLFVRHPSSPTPPNPLGLYLALPTLFPRPPPSLSVSL